MKQLSLNLLFGLVLIAISCSEDSKQKISGEYYAILEIDQSTFLPFTMKIEDGRMVAPDSDSNHVWKTFFEGDSLIIQSTIYESEFHLFPTDEALHGYWYNKQKGQYKMKCVASKNKFLSELGTVHPPVMEETEYDFSGKWQVEFDSENPYEAIGIFDQQENEQDYKGTFLTETGDYRNLEGFGQGKRITLSTFDGAHAFLFTGYIKNDTLKGMFYSGNHWSTDWRAVRKDSASIGDPYELTTQDTSFNLSDIAFEKIEDDALVSFGDKRFNGKAVMIQIMGTWCPNCYDETRYYNQLHEEYADDGLEIVAVCFESQEKNDAKARIRKYREAMGVEYTMLYGGKLAKTNASAAFPFLNEIISYPTTLFFDQDHQLQKIHTGFNGPATGEVYKKYKSEMEAFMKTLLSPTQ